MTTIPQADRLTLHDIAAAHQQFVVLITDTTDWPTRYPELVNLTYTALKDQIEAARDHVDRNAFNLPGGLAFRLESRLRGVQRLHRELDFNIENNLPIHAGSVAEDTLTAANQRLVVATGLTNHTVTPL